MRESCEVNRMRSKEGLRIFPLNSEVHQRPVTGRISSDALDSGQRVAECGNVGCNVLVDIIQPALKGDAVVPEIW